MVTSVSRGAPCRGDEGELPPDSTTTGCDTAGPVEAPASGSGRSPGPDLGGDGWRTGRRANVTKVRLLRKHETSHENITKMSRGCAGVRELTGSIPPRRHAGSFWPGGSDPPDCCLAAPPAGRWAPRRSPTPTTIHKQVSPHCSSQPKHETQRFARIRLTGTSPCVEADPEPDPGPIRARLGREPPVAPPDWR